MVRATTNKDRSFAFLRRNGSGSFALNDMMADVVRQHTRTGRPPPKRAQHYVHSFANQLVQKKYLERRPGPGERYKPQQALSIISRSARALPDDTHPKRISDFYQARTGEIKAVPKHVLWRELHDAEDKLRALRAANEAQRAEAGTQAGPSGEQGIGAGNAAHTHAGVGVDVSVSMGTDTDRSMDVDEDRDENPFLDGDMNGPGLANVDPGAGAGPSGSLSESRGPRTPAPVRTQPAQSYPSPPETAIRPSRQVSYASVSAGLGPGADSSIGEGTSAVHAGLNAPLSTIEEGRAATPGPSSTTFDAGDEFDAIIASARAARAKKQREVLELQRQLAEARAEGQERDGRQARRIADLEEQLEVMKMRFAQAELALVAQKEEAAAARGEREGFKRKHLAAAVALKGSQMQVERRDREAETLVGGLASMVANSRWRA